MSVKPKTNIKSFYRRRQGGFSREAWVSPEPEGPRPEVEIKHLSAEEDGKMLAKLYDSMAPVHQVEFWTLGGATEAAKRAYLFRWGYLVHTGGINGQG